MINTKILKLSQKELDELKIELSKEDYINRENMFNVGDLIEFSYISKDINIKQTGIIIGFSGKNYNKKIIILNHYKDRLITHLNSKLFNYNLIYKNKVKARRAKLYYLINKQNKNIFKK